MIKNINKIILFIYYKKGIFIYAQSNRPYVELFILIG